MASPFWIQLIGFAGVASLLLSFQLNKRSTILVCLIIAQVIFALHFGLLHAWTAVALNLIAISRGMIYYFKPQHRWAQSPLWVYGFFMVFWTAGFLTYEGYHSLFALVAMSCETIGLWSNHPKHIRWWMLACRPFWIGYNLIVGSYAALTGDVLITISLIIGMIRFDRSSQVKH